MATLTTYRLNCSSILGLDNSSASAEQLLMDTYINRGVVDVLRRTGCHVSSATMTETSGTGDYTLATGILRVTGWSWANASTTSMPEQVTVDEILRLRANSDAVAATPASAYAIAGANLLMIWPTPSAADTITVYYIARPTSMSSGAHDSSNVTYGGVPEEFSDAIEYYALWKLADYDDDQSSAQGERYRDLYEKALQHARRDTILKSGGRPRAMVGRRRIAPHNPSTDLRW